MADSSTTTAPILNLITGDCWAQPQLGNGKTYAPVTSQPRKLLSSVDGESRIKLAIFYSMADISIADVWTLIPFAGGCWARRQLPNGIRYIPAASGPMRSLTFVGVVLTGSLGSPDLDGRFLHSRRADPGSDCG